MLNFKDCTLSQLDRDFQLKQIRQSSRFSAWLDSKPALTPFEEQAAQAFQQPLILSVHDWNEVELRQHFIGPIFTLVNFTTNRFNLFAERPFGGTVDGVELGGRPDGIIASGLREPEQPFFCFQEYKRHKDPTGDPAAQVLAAMLVAQTLNQQAHPVYGAHVIGRDWYFMLLQGREYLISEPYVATRADILDILRILKTLKQYLLEFTAHDN